MQSRKRHWTTSGKLVSAVKSLLRSVRAAVRVICRALPALVAITATCGFAAASPDVLVVCPDAFRPALVEWDRYRRSQGHELAYIPPAATADELRANIRQASKSGQLKYVVLIGDEPMRAYGFDARVSGSVNRSVGHNW